ncbi:hypothetical protein PG2093B_0659 [Bifidobacterium pseudolongum subsp. globosum]|uniref:Actin n=1 Tax=Bifidobacterium pseudolongum subsp. globosum TaxID=1690 RepID=A0A4Q5A169_9BIFI|nr:hypothetical protein [Bifidobacterium pseudolongum]RYQ11057.1 hypothetical protein PG2093B_0659 [Bifidobacterium pseudolongum subsp. globosum]
MTTTSNPASNRVSVARQTYQSSAVQTYAALLQTLRFSAGFDVVGNNDTAQSVTFRLPSGDDEYEAHVVSDGVQSAVVIDAPLGVNDKSAAYSRLYRELSEQLAAQTTVANPDVVASHQFWQSVLADNHGPRSKWAIGAVVLSCFSLIGGISIFSERRPDWQVTILLIIAMFVVCGIAFACTGRGGKVSGRRLVLIAVAIACVATVLLLIATTVVQIRYSTSSAPAFSVAVPTNTR